jgi:hypothetical protein
MVERMNLTLKDKIKRDSAMTDTAWDERMPLVLLALRASSHAATKMAPREALSGHRIRMPVGEAPTRQTEDWWSAAETLPPESVQQELLQMKGSIT